MKINLGTSDAFSGSRCGFTRREVIALIALMLLGLMLLPLGLNWMRERYHRLRCENRLWMIHHAFAAHHLDHGYFPDGGLEAVCERSRTSDGMPAIAPRQDWGWGYQVLPYLGRTVSEGDRERLWGTAPPSTRPGERPPDRAYAALWANQKDDEVRSALIAECFCPSRRDPMAAGGWGKIDYAGNGGTDETNGSDGLIIRRGSQRPIRASDVQDGGYTVLIAEKWYNPREPGTHDGDRYGYVSGFSNDTVRWANNRPHADGANGSRDRFGSAHPGVFNALLADGSVRNLALTISPQVWADMCRSNDVPREKER